MRANHDCYLELGSLSRASVQPGPFLDFYQRSLAKGNEPTMVRLTLARKIAAITLTLRKKGENFDLEKLKSQCGPSTTQVGEFSCRPTTVVKL
jgi:hypothetical protein